MKEATARIKAQGAVKATNNPSWRSQQLVSTPPAHSYSKKASLVKRRAVKLKCRCSTDSVYAESVTEDRHNNEKWIIGRTRKQQDLSETHDLRLQELS